MNNQLTVEIVRDSFSRDPKGKLWIPTKTRNEIISDEGFSTKPKTISMGRIYRFHFKGIGGGMWEVSLRNLDGSKV